MVHYSSRARLVRFQHLAIIPIQTFMFHKRYIDPRTPKRPHTPAHHKRISSSQLLSSKPQTLRAGKASGVWVVWVGLIPPFVAYPNFSSLSRNSRSEHPSLPIPEKLLSPEEVFLAQGVMIYAPSENANLLPGSPLLGFLLGR
jgi:hypothetical protein